MIALRDSLILACAAAAVFVLSLSASFHFDDYAIFSDPVLTSTSGWWEVWAPQQTRPLTYFTLWLNHAVGGRNPAGYHAFNLALHVACVLLLFHALAGLIPRRAAVLAAALFAIHPIQTEAVVYVFARGILLATLFCLLSLRSWLRGRHWVAAVWFALALLSKEECAAFPVFLLLLHFSVSRNTREFRPIAVMAGLSLAAGIRVIAATAMRPGAGAGFQAGISPAEYFASQGPVILRYFRLLLFPWGFTVDPDIRMPVAWTAMLAWLAIAGSCAVAARRFMRAREGFWWIGGLVLLLPSSSIFPAADLAADRRMYLPLCAFSVVAGLLLRDSGKRILLPAAILLALLTFGRTWVWLNERSLWEEAVAASPEKIRPRIQLARSVTPENGLIILLDAQRLAPTDASVAAELGKTYLLLGRPDGALAEFGRALAIAPRNAQALNNRGVALMALEQWRAAREDFERALRIDPCLFDARFNLKRLGVILPDNPSCRWTEEQRRLILGG